MEVIGPMNIRREQTSRNSVSPVSQELIDSQERALFDQQQTFNLLQKFYKQKILNQSDTMSPERLRQLMRVEQ